MNTPIIIRKATNDDDLASIKYIASRNKNELGFVRNPALLEAMNKGWLYVAELEVDGPVGFVNFWKRIDGRITILELCVAREYRGQGFGRALIAAIAKEYKTVIRLKCPVDLEANKFYQHLGFTLETTEPAEGRRRALNIWSLT